MPFASSLRLMALALLLGVASPALAQTSGAAPDWLSFSEAIAAAEQSGKPILIYVYAPWCSACKKMEADVYTLADLQAYLGDRFEIGRLNLATTDDRIDFRGYTLSSAEMSPTAVFLESNGDFITRLSGYQDGTEFQHVLRFIATGAYREQSYLEYMGRTSQR